MTDPSILDFAPPVGSFVEWYQSLIVWIRDWSGFPDTLLHLHAGLATLFLARLVSGRSLASFLPLAWVVAVALANEALDYFASDRMWGDALSDIAHTIFWPFALSACCRLRPSVGQRPRTDKDLR